MLRSHSYGRFLSKTKELEKPNEGENDYGAVRQIKKISPGVLQAGFVVTTKGIRFSCEMWLIY